VFRKASLFRRFFPDLAEHARTRAFVIHTTVVLLLALNFFSLFHLLHHSSFRLRPTPVPLPGNALRHGRQADRPRTGDPAGKIHWCRARPRAAAWRPWRRAWPGRCTAVGRSRKLQWCYRITLPLRQD